jgi:hypothetical protein
MTFDKQTQISYEFIDTLSPFFRYLLHSDEWLFEAIINSVKAVRKRLIHECIRFRRVKLLDRLASQLHTELGVDVVADFVHGCRYQQITKLVSLIFFHQPTLYI